MLQNAFHNVYDPEYLLKVKSEAEAKNKKCGFSKKPDESLITYEEAGLRTRHKQEILMRVNTAPIVKEEFPDDPY
jgi:hypothetical protein